MSVFKSMVWKSTAILLLTYAMVANAVPINFEVPLVYSGEPAFDTVAFALQLPNSDFAWDNPAISDEDIPCSTCDGLLFADHGWAPQETLDPRVVGARGPAILDGEIWGSFYLSFFVDPALYPTFELDAIVFDPNLNPMNPQSILLTYDSLDNEYVITDAFASDWTPTYNLVFAVPEASSLALLGIGLVGIGMTKRRKQPLPSASNNKCLRIVRLQT